MKIIEAHEGYLEVENNPGKRMTFRVVVPETAALRHMRRLRQEKNRST